MRWLATAFAVFTLALTACTPDSDITQASSATDSIAQNPSPLSGIDSLLLSLAEAQEIYNSTPISKEEGYSPFKESSPALTSPQGADASQFHIHPESCASALILNYKSIFGEKTSSYRFKSYHSSETSFTQAIGIFQNSVTATDAASRLMKSLNACGNTRGKMAYRDSSPQSFETSIEKTSSTASIWNIHIYASAGRDGYYKNEAFVKGNAFVIVSGDRFPATGTVASKIANRIS